MKISRLYRSGVPPGLTAPSGRRRSSGRNALLPGQCSIRSVTAAPGDYRCTQHLPPSSTTRLPPARDEVPLTLHSSSVTIAEDLESFAVRPPVAADGGVSPSAAAPHTHRAGTQRRRRLDGGARLAAVSRGTGGCTAASPAPVLAAAAHSYARSGAASLERGGCPATESFDPLRYCPLSLLLQHREPVEGARGGCLSAVPGQRRPPGHESSSHRRGTANPSPHPHSSAHCSARGSNEDTSVPRAEIGGRTVALPRDYRRDRQAGSGREGAGRREAAAPDRHRRRRDGGREWKPGRGGNRGGHAQEMQEPKIFHHCSRPPAPIRRGTSRAPRSAAGRQRHRCGAPASAGAAIEMTPELRFGRSGLGPAPSLRTCRSLRPVCERGGARLGELWRSGVVMSPPGVPVHGVFGPLKVRLRNGQFAKASAT
ncbi:uncharacterized protein LOC121339449 [Onychostruthus taczanowskii]|uniref:uncharacterized protein LOC121339449 n=1 Tax=Onychostruthus taczanowskii TaxID=356909 RepID=UPI001B8095D5|nr:uncharacterized protein LOC121339449 [Onychostruthus taczanowskii]